ncbi:hypothetical protein [Halomonas chromatireducens]|uniref:DUF2946 domain-containing protein n=1 Tax=Halomonas chromatireducens TaxID=507626 RepID=A0A120JWG5_9GAMM|nr:hypothetical protein [Halomonas chromatireducens]AMD01892.1 hypothetical protein LOKO_02841 [Halomonas chromatireducens]
MALLLALLLAMTSLSGHGAIQADSADCLQPQAMMQLDSVDADDHRCSACSALMPLPALSTAEPAVPSTVLAVTYADRTPLPPRRPPRT